MTVWCPSLQPILSAINTQLHKVAMFLVPLLTPLISNNYITEDSFVIVPSFDCAHYMTSFNTQTLFTNIQLEEETINICADKLFENKLKLKLLFDSWLLPGGSYKLGSVQVSVQLSSHPSCLSGHFLAIVSLVFLNFGCWYKFT